MSIARPSNIHIAFADGGDRNAIPVADATPLASYDVGFPPITMTAIVAGGVPPQGKDFNGVFYDITSHTLWVNAGGQYLFDAALSTAIGGYPAGMVLQDTAGASAYVSAVNNNTTDFNSTPGSIGTLWMPWAGASLRNASIIWCGTSGGSANVQTFTPSPAIAAVVAGQTFSGIAGFTNTGSLTVNISGTGPVVVKRASPSGPVVLTGGEWVAGNVITLKFDGTFLELTDTDLGQLALLNIGEGLENDGAGGLRVKTADTSIRRSGAGVSAANPISSVSTAQAVTLAKNNTQYVATAAVVFTADLSSTLFNGFSISIYAYSGSSTFTPNAADSVNGGAAGVSYTILAGQSMDFDTDGAGHWWPTSRTTPAGGYYPLYENANVTVGPGNYAIDTSGGVFTLTLTAGPAVGDSVRLFDEFGSWGSFPLTVARNGQTIMGIAEDLLCNVPGVDFMLVFNGTTWRLF
jgi:hypothetical protein